MNAKYFEENRFESIHGSKFHKAVLDHATCIASNLMFDATHPDNADAFRIIKQSGKTVLLTVAEQQQAMDFDDETGEIYG